MQQQPAFFFLSREKRVWKFLPRTATLHFMSFTIFFFRLGGNEAGKVSFSYLETSTFKFGRFFQEPPKTAIVFGGR